MVQNKLPDIILVGNIIDDVDGSRVSLNYLREDTAYNVRVDRTKFVSEHMVRVSAQEVISRIKQEAGRQLKRIYICPAGAL